MRFGDPFSVNARKLSIYLRFSRRFFELLNKLPLKHEGKSFYVTKQEKKKKQTVYFEQWIEKAIRRD